MVAVRASLALGLLVGVAAGAAQAEPRAARRAPQAVAPAPVAAVAAEPEAAPLPVPPVVPQPRPVGFDELPGWGDAKAVGLLAVVLDGCAALAGLPPERPLGGAPALAALAGQPRLWREACDESAALARTLRPPPRRRPPPPRVARREAAEREAAARAFLERRFQPFAMGTGTMTGYYEPELRGNTIPGGAYQVPLHAVPPSPGPGRRHPDRTAIEAGALDGAGLELVWVDDPVDAFFLHIQGSGRVVLPDGRMLRVGYAGQNGHPYRGVGGVLLERGAITRAQMSMQAIRAWLAAAPPGDAAALLRHNASYVFFRIVEGLTPAQGPIGAMGVPLTPRRSVAVDPAHVPLGAPVWIATRDWTTGAPLRQLALAQDVGGAIRGPARGDYFWGWGAEAAERAGGMKEPVEMVVLLPRPPEAEGGPVVAAAAAARPPLAEVAAAPRAR